MNLRERIQQHERGGARPQSVKIWRTRATATGRPVWHGEYNGERLTGLSCESVCNAIADKNGGEPVEVR